MLQRKATAEKILLIGLDGLDPRLTRKYVDMGLMPKTKELIERGAAREDLVMLGGHPTVTPPMWTTLATGANSNVHGIVEFFRHSKTELDAVEYNMDSRLCTAEPLWNVFAEAGKKTLVWHWPGSSWPPTSDSPNLLVVDGTSPGSVAMSNCQREAEFLVTANEKFTEVTLLPRAASSASAPCVIEDLDIIEDKPIVLHREANKVELMLCTGLKDKNNKEIYEGDIVSLDSLSGFVVEYDSENARFIFNGEHKDKDYGHCGFHLYAQKEIEVIGNIYENADLLR